MGASVHVIKSSLLPSDFQIRYRLWSLPRAGSGETTAATFGDPEAGRFALAAGLDRSFLARDWAVVLARHACVVGVPRSGYDRWLRSAQREWRSRFHGSSRPDVEAAALGAVELDERGGELWMRALSLGDVCVFWVRGGRTLERFPLDEVESFGAGEGFSSEPTQGPRAPRLMERRLRAGDQLVLATEGLSRWLYDWIDAGAAPWPDLLESSEGLTEALQRERRRGSLADGDDVMVLIETAPPSRRPMMTLIPEVGASSEARAAGPRLYALPTSAHEAPAPSVEASASLGATAPLGLHPAGHDAGPSRFDRGAGQAPRRSTPPDSSSAHRRARTVLFEPSPSNRAATRGHAARRAPPQPTSPHPSPPLSPPAPPRPPPGRQRAAAPRTSPPALDYVDIFEEGGDAFDALLWSDEAPEIEQTTPTEPLISPRREASPPPPRPRGWGGPVSGSDRVTVLRGQGLPPPTAAPRAAPPPGPTPPPPREAARPAAPPAAQPDPMRSLALAALLGVAFTLIIANLFKYGDGLGYGAQIAALEARVDALDDEVGALRGRLLDLEALLVWLGVDPAIEEAPPEAAAAPAPAAAPAAPAAPAARESEPEAEPPRVAAPARQTASAPPTSPPAPPAAAATAAPRRDAIAAARGAPPSAAAPVAARAAPSVGTAPATSSAEPAPRSTPAAVPAPQAGTPTYVWIECQPEICAVHGSTVTLGASVHTWSLDRRTPLPPIPSGTYPRDPRQLAVRDHWVRVQSP